MREYEIDINGIPHTVQLSDAEAKRLGMEDAVVEPEKPVRTRSRSTRTKED